MYREMVRDVQESEDKLREEFFARSFQDLTCHAGLETRCCSSVVQLYGLISDSVVPFIIFKSVRCLLTHELRLARPAWVDCACMWDLGSPFTLYS